MDTVTITDRERAVLIAIRDSYYGNGETWAADLNDQTASPSGVTGRALSAVCSSLAQKRLISTAGSGKDSAINLTPAGFAAVPKGSK